MESTSQPTPTTPIPTSTYRLPQLFGLFTAVMLAVIGFLFYQNRKLRLEIKNTTLLETAAPYSSEKLNPTRSSISFENPDDLMIQMLGKNYYENHFKKHDEIQLLNDVVKIGYKYSYPPYVLDYAMGLFYDSVSGNISTRETSTVLLYPQEFRISQSQAQNIAKSKGLYDCNSYIIKPLIHINASSGFYNNRFVWDISGKDGCAKLTSKNRGVITEISIDVETGEVYSTRKNEPAVMF